MNLHDKLFGDGKKDKAPTPQEDRIIQRLRELEEMLMKKSEFLEKKINEQIAIAKKNGTKNKRVALQALKRKRRYKQVQTQIDGTLYMIDSQTKALENAKINTVALKLMSVDAPTLKGSQKNMDADKIYDWMNKLVEQQEIPENLTNPVNLDTDMDEDELVIELEELLQKDLENPLLLTQIPGELPCVPSAEPQSATGNNKVENESMQEQEITAS